MATQLEHIEPGQRPYQPYGAARDLFHCRDTEILIEGPAGTGKTRAILEKIHFLCEYKYPGMRALVCRKTRKSLTESALVTFEEKVLPADSAVKAGPSRGHRDVYRYANGSEIVIGGLDYPERLFSTEFDVIAIFEATETTLNDYESLHRALRNGVMPYQQIICDCNPSYPSHWLNQRAAGTRMTRLLSRFEENPSLTPQYLKILSELTGVRRDRLYMGRWVAAEGAVYPDFDPAVHVADRFEVPKGWRRFRVVDYGYTNPFTCQWWACDEDGRLFLYREIYYSKRLVEDHARQILTLSGDEAYEATITDHDAEDRATMERRGIPSIPALKAVTVGIQAVNNRLRVAGDGKPRLTLMRDSLVERDSLLVEGKKPTCLAEEVESYLWHEPKDGKAEKEEPVKVDDHGCDAMRYMVMYLDGAAMPSIAGLDDGGRGHKGEEPGPPIVGVDKGWCTADNDAIFTEC